MLRSPLLIRRAPYPPLSFRSPFSTETKLIYIPQKVKEEMAGLHDEDAARWNATTLAARFSAPKENVETWLKLCKLRSRPYRPKTRTDDEQKTVADLRKKAVSAWMDLPEVRGMRERLARPSIVERIIVEEEDAEGGEDGETAGAKVVKNAEDAVRMVEGEKAAVEVKKSRTAEWVEELCNNAPRDVVRRTTFAFIEVGEGVQEGVERAVWIREGKTGALRVAKEAEREVLLSKVRSVDPSVWQ